MLQEPPPNPVIPILPSDMKDSEIQELWKVLRREECNAVYIRGFSRGVQAGALWNRIAACDAPGSRVDGKVAQLRYEKQNIEHLGIDLDAVEADRREPRMSFNDATQRVAKGY